MGRNSLGWWATRRGMFGFAGASLGWLAGAAAAPGRARRGKRPTVKLAGTCGDICAGVCDLQEDDVVVAQVFESARDGRLRRVEVGLASTGTPGSAYFVQVVQAFTEGIGFFPGVGRSSVLATALVDDPGGGLEEETKFTLIAPFNGPKLEKNVLYAVVVGRVDPAVPFRFLSSDPGVCERYFRVPASDPWTAFSLGSVNLPLAISVFVA